MLNMKGKVLIGFAILLAIVIVVSGDVPNFEINYENKIVEEGSKVQMNCSATGEKPITYEWFENEGQYDNKSQIRIQAIGDHASIYAIEIVSKNHEGLYTCTARNTHGLSSKTFDMKVVASSNNIRFEDCPGIQNLVVGQEGKITCRAVANPKPTISWVKDDNPLKSDRVTVTEFGVSITSVDEEDEGTYSLEAYVKETGSIQLRDIEVNVLTPPKINDLPEEFLVIQGEEYTITCGASGSDPLTFIWLDHDLRDLSQVAGYSVDQGRLTISKVERNAGGDYTCRVTNPAGQDQATVKIEVQVLPNILRMENLTRDEGKDAVFECLGEGVPKPTMTIRRDNSNEDIMNNPEEGVELEVFDDGEFNRLRLQITSVKRSDDGLYYCKASNAAGVTERTGHLQVQFRPDMSRTQTTTVKTWSDNPANLSCIAEAIPNATITWKFQGDPIELGDDRFRVFGGISYSNLLVMTADRDDYDVIGTYTCEARNALGENSVQIPLEKAYRPSPLTQIVFDKITPTTITFRLMGPGNNGGMPITHYNMKYKFADNKDDPVKEVTWDKDTPYILSNLIPRAKYVFSAAAINVVGVGDYKQAIYIMPDETVPEPPVIKTSQETVSEYPDRCEVRWDVPNNNGKPILKYSILYFKVKRDIRDWIQVEKSTEKIVDAEVLSFVISSLIPDTYYKIEIRAANEIGNSLPESVVVKTSKASGDLPTFEINYENIRVEEGSQVKMNCSATGEKPITYEWYENEGQYDNNSQIRIQEIEDQASIYIIEIVTKNHEGLYTCTARNTHGLSSKTFDLEVVPSSNNNSNDDASYISKAGVENVGTTSVVFSIEIIGSAESIEVEYNESREGKARMTQWNYGDRYEIKDLIPGGSYVFRFRIVHSVVGNWSREYQVILLPDTPEVIFYNLENGNFKIGWNRKFDDIMRGTIDKYELAYMTVRNEGGNRWVPSKCPITVLIPPCATSSYTISGLSKNVYYEIQLRAHTAAGYGEPFKQKIFFSSN